MTSRHSPPFVSIIIPVYNEERYIRPCLESVLALDHPRELLEVIVVDNNSSDATPLIVREVLERSGIGRIVTKVGGSIASVRNYGYQHARGDVLAFLDGDSVVEPGWLKKGLELLNSEDVVCSGFAMAVPAPESHWVQKAWFDIGNSSRHKGTTQVKWLCSFNLILKRGAFEAVGGFSEALETGEDFDLGVKLGSMGKILFSDATRVVHLGNINSLPAFITKEFWRGRGELYHVIMLRTKIKDFISTAVSICYFLAVAGFFPSAIVYNPPLLFLCVSVIVSFPMIMLARSGIFSPGKILRGYAFYLFYFVTRGIAAFMPVPHQ